MAEQPAYGIRQVTERNSRSNDGCVEMATGNSWPTPANFSCIAVWRLLAEIVNAYFRPRAN